ncbi:Txe/YoeB family addiction module toxin [Methylosinus sp. PW1]|uniref:Txe/YoeB family addiction module toxin n=1 Tax=Methylosinus sp. PW1 TaxID=107636 RepID=UPI00055F3ED8|nr:Txe/YoeB family addiction module toxin [Methylosinus sp. PW1]
MKLVFAEQAWDDYLYWQAQNAKILERLNGLLRARQRTPFVGTGKREPLRGWRSRRITLEHRLVYRVEDESLSIAQRRYHY